jgi:hypothetical protein
MACQLAGIGITYTVPLVCGYRHFEGQKGGCMMTMMMMMMMTMMMLMHGCMVMYSPVGMMYAWSNTSIAAEDVLER